MVKHVEEVMTRDVESVRPDASLKEAAEMMRTLNEGSLPVVDGEKLAGIITDRDIVVRAVAKGMDINTTKINDFMSPAVVTVTGDQTAQEAAKLMAQHQVRRLPVVEDGRLIGIIAIGDLAVVGIHENEAGFALSEISEPARPELH
jgi:CBS domain-containing protein